MLIVFWFVLDLLGMLIGMSGVAYAAHLGGCVAGVVVAIALLKLDWAGDSPSPSLLDLNS